MQAQSIVNNIEPLLLNVGAQIEDAKIHARCTPKSIKRPRCHESEWVCPVSKRAKKTLNPIRHRVDQIVRRIKPAHFRRDRKHPISLANGDPTTSGNFQPCHAAIEAVTREVLRAPHSAPYTHALGMPKARAAIAQHHSHANVQLKADDIIVTNGASGALDLALKTLLDSDSTVLVPEPGFPLYEEIANSIGAKVVHYRLDREQNWECDFNDLESIVLSQPNVRAIVVNNPSSPTGSVFSEHHLGQIVQFARKFRLPILADEVYGNLTYGMNAFYPIAQVAAKHGRFVPVLTVSGISKQYLLPGWRIGWLCFHDNIYNTLRNIKRGAFRLAEVSHGVSSLAQAAIPTLLDESTPGLKDWKQKNSADSAAASI